MFRLAHLSDPHLGPLPDPRLVELASKRVLGYVNWRRNRAVRLTNRPLDLLVADIKAGAPDHLAVTGDLVNLALRGEFEPAARWLATLGPVEDVSVVPGNHDAYVPGAVGRAARFWMAHMVGDGHEGGRPTFPYVRRRGRVAIVGTTSARATGPFMATGHFSNGQSVRLAEILHNLGREGFFRVVMIHHPPLRGVTSWHKRLVGGTRFRAAIAEAGAELVLHGHTHRASVAHIPGPRGPVAVIGVPSASAVPDGHHEGARYNLFEIGGKPGAWRVAMRERGLLEPAGEIVEIAARDLAIA